jgi:hypothetical protein
MVFTATLLSVNVVVANYRGIEYLQTANRTTPRQSTRLRE